MGTRNLTCVFSDGEYRVAQYAQWDGYPEGQGLTALKFLRDEENIKKLKCNLQKVRFLDVGGADKAFVEAYNKNIPDGKTPEQLHWFESYKSRNIGAKILHNIANSEDEEIILANEIDFAGDSLMCEGAYVIDFDKGTFESYEGFNKSPLSDGERFKDAPLDDKRTEFEGEGKKYKYCQVKHVVTFKLDALPSDEEFLSAFPDEDNED